MKYSMAEIACLLAKQTGDMRQYLNQLAMLNESGQCIQERGVSLPALLQRVLRTAKTLTGARYAALGVFDETGERLAQFLTDGVDEEMKHAIGRLPTGRGLLGTMTKEEGALRLNDLTQHKDSVGFPPHHPVMQSFLGISIRAHGKLFGRLYLTDKLHTSTNEHGVSTHEVGEFTDLDEQLITALGFQAGTAIETASLIEEIRATQSRDRAVLDSVEEGIFGIDLAGRCLFVNRACADALGYVQGELVGMNIHAMIHHTRENGTPFPEAECPILGTLHTQQKCRLENEIFWRKNGTSFSATCTVTSLRDEFGTVTGAVVSFVDCTERRAIEMQRRQGQRMEALGYLAAGVAHDFNNLLMVMKGYGELLLQTDLPASSRMKIEEIKKATDRATVLTSQLLAFGRKKPIERKVVDINDLIRGMEPFLRRLRGEEIALHLDLIEGQWFANIDVGGIEQALMNLVVNAREAMPTGGLVEIRTTICDRVTGEQSHVLKHSGPSIAIIVSDTGAGMDKATQARIFEPFFTTKAGGGGTGLGLATVFRIVTENDGGIQVGSEPGVGTTFTVVLPLVESLEEPTMPVVNSPIHGGDETVLLIEDNVDVQMLVKTMLENKGYHVLTANDGREGKHVARTYEGTIHLVISDAMMPHMSGWAITRSLKVQRPDLRVLFITGRADAEMTSYGDLSTQGEVLSKPFTSDALLGTVRRMLDRPGGHLFLPSASRESKRILLLDDDRQVSSMLREMLQSEEYEVLVPANGTEGLSFLRQEPVDLLITDMLMPEMDGIEVIREVRRLWPSLKILAMSGGGIGTTPEVYLTLAQQLGAVSTLAKPFSHEQLLTVVHELID